jgi:2-oxoglutarate dehydrogenase E2 component (dihydrolipoamide succinyltransferase)
MPVELKVPASGESITEVQIGRWLKKEGDRVERDEVVVEIETDKAAVELPAPVGGRLGRVVKKDGEACRVGDVIGYIEEGEGSAPPPVMPAAQRVLAEHKLRPDEVTATGPGGRLLKEDVLRHVETAASGTVGDREEEVVPMSLLRRRIAGRLVEAQQTAALLTTFNEIDMSGVVALRRDFGPAFQEKYGVKLGLMSFFVKAAVDALKLVPAVNAEIRGTDIVYRNYYDIGVAVGGGKGLVVPVLRHAERLSFAEIERAIADFAARARDNKLKVEELQGGTFTISNGGIYGSMLSTPIVNPPQSGILGLHAMQDRPVARDGQVVVRPMMYVALTYDHRLIDGREAVTFLKHIKEVIETPARMLIEV